MAAIKLCNSREFRIERLISYITCGQFFFFFLIINNYNREENLNLNISIRNTKICQLSEKTLGQITLALN